MRLKVKVYIGGAVTSQTLGWILDREGKVWYRIRPIAVVDVNLRKPEPNSLEFRRYVELAHDTENWRRLPRCWSGDFKIFVSKTKWVEFESVIPLEVAINIRDHLEFYGSLTDDIDWSQPDIFTGRQADRAISIKVGREIMARPELAGWNEVDDDTAC